ncbi:hypothetical protein NDU88_005756 [Pleurodeles waltl]|uniref:Uncharacterized protein n=1 Tax=Pleurodeles waltl TaxID=8319 RepID=A0AAV7NT58_PLEWA|nr:hypothetical protein NDU88_005756 [Pleurodeles waltl]
MAWTRLRLVKNVELRVADSHKGQAGKQRVSPLRSRPPVWPPGWWREGASGGAKLRDPSDGSRVRRRRSECGLRTSAEPWTKARRRTGPGRVAKEAPGSALFCLGSPGAGAPRCPLVRRGERGPRGRWTTEEPGPEDDHDDHGGTEQKSTGKEALSHED